MPSLTGPCDYRDSVASWLSTYKLHDGKLQAELDTSPGEPDTVGALTLACSGAVSAAVALAWVGRWMGPDKANELAGLMQHYASNGGDDYTLFNDSLDGVAPGEASVQQDPWEPNWTIRPGAHLQEWLDQHEVSVNQFVSRSGLGYHVVSGVLDGSRRINKAVAAALTQVTGIAECFWLQAETNYRRDLDIGLVDATVYDR